MNDDHERSVTMFVYDGSFAPSVADLTAATLSEKNLLNVSTSIAELMGDRPWLRRASTDRHNFCDEPLSASTVVSLNVRRLYWRKFRYLTRHIKLPFSGKFFVVDVQMSSKGSMLSAVDTM
jgi:hypothetical protein